MILLSTVIDTFGADFLAQYRHRLGADHVRALSAMKQCRTQASLKMRVQCEGCEHQILVPHSCGHRHCPHCQHHESQRWLERQISRQLPVEYFMLTFTLPAEFRALSWAHQNVVYDLLLRASWETARTFSENDKQLQGTPGAIAVLHTNTRRLDYHPHVHLVMPAAAINGAQKRWRTKRSGRRATSPGQAGAAKGSYLFSHKALAKVFRAKILAGIEAAGLTLPVRYPKEWVVDCKSVGTGEKALIYLGRYLYRGVIREKDIVACGDGRVSFRFRNARTGKMEQKTVTGAQFLWLVIQHVLPKGLRRARNFGFLHPNCKRLIALLHVLLKFVPTGILPMIRERPPVPCPCCGAAMKIMQIRLRPMPLPIAAAGAN